MDKRESLASPGEAFMGDLFGRLLETPGMSSGRSSGCPRGTTAILQIHLGLCNCTTPTDVQTKAEIESDCASRSWLKFDSL